MTMSTEALLNVKEVANFLQINVTTVYAWAQSGRMPAIKLGRSWRFRRSDLEAWLNRNRRDLKEITEQNQERTPDVERGRTGDVRPI